MPRPKASAVAGALCDGDLHGRLSEIIEALVDAGVPLEQARSEFERQYVVAALRASEGGVSRSAGLLGVHRNTLRNKVASLAIRPSDYSQASRK